MPSKAKDPPRTPIAFDGAMEPMTLHDRLKDARFELLRYVMYALDIAFGVMMWAGTADDLLWIENRCAPFSGEDVFIPPDRQPTCGIVIGFGVVMTFAVLFIVLWHSLRYCNGPWLGYGVEMVMFYVLSLMFFILGLVTLAKTSSFWRRFREVRVVISGAWLAGFTHLFSGIIAFLQWKGERERYAIFRAGKFDGEDGVVSV